MKIKYWAIGLSVVIFSGLVGFYSIFNVPSKPQIISINQQHSASDWYCHQSPSRPPAIDNHGQLNLLVWNIHKQGDQGWKPALTQFSQDKQLLLLQEASLTQELQQWVTEQEWGASYVNAFKAFGVSAGVLNLASQLPIRACAYTSVEPWIQLPKSALYARYSLSNGQDLVVVNIHAINFTLGTEDFEKQIVRLENAVKKHEGPLLIAGDFNTWSDSRLRELRQITHALGMQEVAFTPDHRKRFINDLPFDHVFYRGLQFVAAQSPQTTSSDHNPLLVQFRLE